MAERQSDAGQFQPRCTWPAGRLFNLEVKDQVYMAGAGTYVLVMKCESSELFKAILCEAKRKKCGRRKIFALLLD